MINKKIIFIFTFVLLFLFSNRVYATNMFNTNSYSKLYNEDLIFEDFSTIEGYDINKNPNIFCFRSGDSYVCYSLSTDLINSLEYDSIYSMYKINLDGCHYYYFSRGKYGTSNDVTEKRDCSYNNSFLTITTRESYANFDFFLFSDEEKSLVTKIDFSKYITKTEEETKQMEILSKSSNLLTIMLYHSTNIINVLFSSQVMLMCLGIILTYLCFLVIYKVLKK